MKEDLSLQSGKIDPICNFLFLKTPPPVKIFNFFYESINFSILYAYISAVSLTFSVAFFPA